MVIELVHSQYNSIDTITMIKQLYDEYEFRKEVNEKIKEYYQEKSKILFCKRAEKMI